MPKNIGILTRFSYLAGFFLVALFTLSFAEDDYAQTAAEVRAFLLENHLYSEESQAEREAIAQCFQPENPFQYCLVLLNGRWQYVDEKLNAPYDIFMFDNGPDEPSEGFYRITQNGKIGFADVTTGKIAIPAIYECAHPFKDGKAKVGLKCRTMQDREHFYWEAEEWLLLNKPE